MATPETTPATVADVLDRAAEQLAAHGWLQEETFDDAAFDGGADIRTVAACLSGAVRAQAGLSRHDSIMLSELRLEDEHPTAYAAETALATWLVQHRGALRDKSAGGTIADWNDNVDRTTHEVVTALRECAAEIRSGS